MSYQAERLKTEAKRAKALDIDWHDGQIADFETGKLVDYHRGQELAWQSDRRTVAIVAGTQSGKTTFAPWWLAREIRECGQGDYLAVTASYDLFKLKLLPAMRQVFEDILEIGRYWPGNRIIEIKDLDTGQFWAKWSDDRMWARIVLRSADSLGGLESATAKAAIEDEAGQDRFTLDAHRAIRRRLALHKGRVLLTTTLYNLGWVVQEVIDRAGDGGVTSIEHVGEGELEYTDNADADIALVQLDSIINPSFPIDEYEEARLTMPEDEFQLFYRGRKAALRTLIYDAFDRARHTRPRFPIPAGWSRYLGLDFGADNTAALFYAEEPDTGRLYCYREYLEGKRTAAEHVDALLEDEPGLPLCVGGPKSEKQWRREFIAGGLPILAPRVADVNLGINRVYGEHKKDGIVYFDDLRGVLDEKGRYRRKRDRHGNVTQDIENKNAFHFCDAERYIVGYIRGGETRGEGKLGEAGLPQHSRWSGAWSSMPKTTARWKRSKRF